jgi:hypothetical protein
LLDTEVPRQLADGLLAELQLAEHHQAVRVTEQLEQVADIGSGAVHFVEVDVYVSAEVHNPYGP